MSENNQCPVGQSTKTHMHLHTCNASKMVDQCKKAVDKLQSCLLKQKTSPSISSVILDGVRTIWKETPSKKSSRRLLGLTDNISSQNCIGWWALICGRWSLKWAQAQQTYFDAIQSPRSTCQ